MYGSDKHPLRALAWIREATDIVAISCLNRFELFNPLRFSESRKLNPPGIAVAAISQFEQDIREGHVAVVRLKNVAHFLTFDANQKKLAEGEGFIVPF